MTMMVSLFRPQNKRASVCRLCHKTDGRMRRRGHASRSSDLLRVEANLARVFQSGLKTRRGVMTGGARGTIAEVASESS
jgi:hypothetical protein